MPTLKANIAGVWTPIGYAPPSRFTATTDGIVPLSGGGTVNFLRADGTWAPAAAVPAGGTVGQVLVKQSATAGDATWSTSIGTAVGTIIQLGSGSDANVRIGDDAAFRDANAAHTLKLESQSDSSLGLLCFGSYAKRIGNDTNMTLKSDGPVYYDGTAHYFRAVNGTGLFYHDGSNMSIPTGRLFFGSNGDVGPSGGEFRVAASGATSTVTITADNLYCLNKAGNAWHFQFTASRFYTTRAMHFDFAGYAVCHASDTDTGLYYYADSEIGLVSNGQTIAQTYAGSVLSIPNNVRIRLYAKTDSNNELQYVSSTPTGSGEASNGPKLNGYASVWLHQQIGDKSIYLASSGNAYVNAGNSWITFSSREFKHNIKTLDPERALLMVGRWRPVEYDWNEDVNAPHPHGFGFIAEEHAEVLPEMCSIYGESVDGAENERVVIHRPGWAHGITLGDGVPWLAGAIQALLLRIENLETELERIAA